MITMTIVMMMALMMSNSMTKTMKILVMMLVMLLVMLLVMMLVMLLVMMIVMMQVLTIGQTHFRTNVGIWQPSPAAPTRAFRRLDAPTILCIGRHHCIACHHPDALLGNCIAPTPLTSAHRPQI